MQMMKLDSGLLNELSRRSAKSRVFLFLDFDGTLAPIADHPRNARLPPATRRVLIQLKSLPHFKLSVVSGRPLAELKRLVPLKGVAFAGNHGLEIEGDRFRWIHPEAERFRFEAERTYLRLRKMADGVPGVYAEHKGFSLSLHYRLVPKSKVSALYSRFVNLAQPLLSKGAWVLANGKKVWELKPAIAWNKGKAVLWMLRKFQSVKSDLILFAGDDDTDEDAFRTLRKRGMTICVGRRKTHAKHRLRNHREVRALLEALWNKRN
jgi:trehalose-phosphatase